MKHKKVMMVITLALAAIFVFAACTTPEPMATDDAIETEMEAEPTEEAMEAESADTDMESEDAAMEEPAPMEDSTMAMTDDEMIALITEKLDGNHDIDRVLNGDKTREEWVTTLDRMIDYGAQINDEEKTLIIDWLLSR